MSIAFIPSPITCNISTVGISYPNRNKLTVYYGQHVSIK